MVGIVAVAEGDDAVAVRRSGEGVKGTCKRLKTAWFVESDSFSWQRLLTHSDSGPQKAPIFYHHEEVLVMAYIEVYIKENFKSGEVFLFVLPAHLTVPPLSSVRRG